MVTIAPDRVIEHTSDEANERIRRDLRARLAYYNEHRDEIPARLEQLDQEWDVERVLETGSASLTLAGIALSILVDRKWLLLSAAVQGFFLQHAVQGWCPPLPVVRRLGVRTQTEIEAERCALRSMLGVESGRRIPL